MEKYTNWFTFGQNHTHMYNDVTLDKDIVVQITSNNPRDTMFKLFKTKWAFQYSAEPDMSWYPRGIYVINED